MFCWFSQANMHGFKSQALLKRKKSKLLLLRVTPASLFSILHTLIKTGYSLFLSPLSPPSPRVCGCVCVFDSASFFFQTAFSHHSLSLSRFFLPLFTLSYTLSPLHSLTIFMHCPFSLSYVAISSSVSLSLSHIFFYDIYILSIFSTHARSFFLSWTLCLSHSFFSLSFFLGRWIFHKIYMLSLFSPPLSLCLSLHSESITHFY